MKTQTALTSSLTLYWRKRKVTWVYGGCTHVYSWSSSTMRTKLMVTKVQLTFVLLGLPYPWGQKVLFSFYPISFISTFFEHFWSRSSRSLQNVSVWSLRTLNHLSVPKLTSFIRSQFSAKTEVFKKNKKNKNKLEISISFRLLWLHWVPRIMSWNNFRS